MSEETPELNKPEKPDNLLRNSLKGWKEDKLLRFYDWVCALIALVFLFILGWAMLITEHFLEFCYFLVPLILVFTIIGIINYKSKK